MTEKTLEYRLQGTRIATESAMSVYAGTNCPQGAAANSGRTCVDLDLPNADCEVKIEYRDYKEGASDKAFTTDGVRRVTILLQGDDACANLVQLLRQAADTIERQYGGKIAQSPAEAVDEDLSGPDYLF